MNPRAVIDRVIDGDTIWVRMRVRLPQDAPERSESGGTEATTRLKKKWMKGKRIQLSMRAVDDYGRVVADIIPDASKVN